LKFAAGAAGFAFISSLLLFPFPHHAVHDELHHVPSWLTAAAVVLHVIVIAKPKTKTCPGLVNLLRKIAKNVVCA